MSDTNILKELKTAIDDRDFKKFEEINNAEIDKGDLFNIVSYMLNRPALEKYINAILTDKDSDGIVGDSGTLLHVAAKIGSPKSFDTLMEFFPKSLEEIDKDGHTPLMISLIRNYPDMIVKIASTGCELNYHNKKGETPLFLAAKRSTAEIITLLIEFGADVNYQNEKGSTVLIQMALTKSMEAIEVLLENGAISTIVNKNDLDALYAAIIQKYDVPTIVTILLESGANEQREVVMNGEKITPLEMAIKKKKYQTIQVIKNFINT